MKFKTEKNERCQDGVQFCLQMELDQLARGSEKKDGCKAMLASASLLFK